MQLGTQTLDGYTLVKERRMGAATPGLRDWAVGTKCDRRQHPESLRLQNVVIMCGTKDLKMK